MEASSVCECWWYYVTFVSWHLRASTKLFTHLKTIECAVTFTKVSRTLNLWQILNFTGRQLDESWRNFVRVLCRRDRLFIQQELVKLVKSSFYIFPTILSLVVVVMKGIFRAYSRTLTFLPNTGGAKREPVSPCVPPCFGSERNKAFKNTI